MQFPFWPDFSGYRNIELGLSRVYQLLQRLDNPHHKLPPTIHLAGTNGKGSTLSFVRSIFSEAGYRVSCYTSPHLVNFNERIVLNGCEISDEFLTEILHECQKAANQEPAIPVTFFEGITVAAFLAFSRVKSDILLLETGMGGRLDATNVLEQVLCSIITPIAFDHTDFLGKTLNKIAFEKAGIIKKNCPVIIAKQKKSALQSIANQALKMNSATKVFGKDWQVKKQKNGFVFFGFGEEISLSLPSLLGDHQIDNASVAIATILNQTQFLISQNHIKSAIAKTFWPARLQKISNGKFTQKLSLNDQLYLDGSHNLQGSATIAKFLKSQKNQKIFVVFSMLQDKDCRGFLQKIQPYVDHLLTLPIKDEPKSRSSEEISEIAKEIGFKSITKTQSLSQAFEILTKLRVNEDEEYLILVCGSLYLAGNFLAENAI